MAPSRSPAPKKTASSIKPASGKPGAKARGARQPSEDSIDKAIEGSFPASDPPSFNPGLARPARRAPK